jgi:hypothetical protein
MPALSLVKVSLEALCSLLLVYKHNACTQVIISLCIEPQSRAGYEIGPSGRLLAARITVPLGAGFKRVDKHAAEDGASLRASVQAGPRRTGTETNRGQDEQGWIPGVNTCRQATSVENLLV